MASRDPLSVHYDAAVIKIMLRAKIASDTSHPRVQVWIASPRIEHAHPDAGGRTQHERAFTRSMYYHVWKVPVKHGHEPGWSVKLDWGSDAELRPSSAGRWARPVKIRMWPRRLARVTGPRWTDSPSLQSKIGDDGQRVIPGLAPPSPKPSLRPRLRIRPRQRRRQRRR